MSSKKSLVFSILLLFSFFTFVTINSAEESWDILSPLKINERTRLIEREFSIYKITTSKKLKEDILAVTEGYHNLGLCDLIHRLNKQTSTNISFEKVCYKKPTLAERLVMVEDRLAGSHRDTSKLFEQNIAELTEDFNMLQLYAFLSTIIEESEPGSLNQELCLQKLEEAINNIDNEQNKKEKLSFIEELRKFLKKNADIARAREQETPKYPLLKDVFHPGMELFESAAKQLKAGKFKNSFRRGMLFYGPPGVGKTEMVKALANESGCKFFKIPASQLVNKYQGSGATAITDIFAQAKAVKPNKGVIIFIDELESIAPKTTDDGIQFSSKYQGQDHSNALAQLWTEFDDCSESNSNILIVAASNKFNVIDKRIQDRFRCIEFSCPDQDSMYKILKNKAQHFKVNLSDAELQFHAKRMKGLSGRELTTFIQDVSARISDGVKKEEAIELVMQEQANTKKNTGPSMFETIERKINRWGRFAQDSLAIIGLAVVGVRASYWVKEYLKSSESPSPPVSPKTTHKASSESLSKSFL